MLLLQDWEFVCHLPVRVIQLGEEIHNRIGIHGRHSNTLGHFCDGEGQLIMRMGCDLGEVLGVVVKIDNTV